MPRPTNKTDLLEQINREYEKLTTLIDDLTPTEMISVKVTTNWTTKDVLAHLTEWSEMAMGWHKTGLKGKQPVMPAEGFNWREIPALNEQIFLKHKDEELKSVQKNFKKSVQKMQKLVDSLSDTELFERSVFPWTGKNNVATYMISGSCSHYDWASKRIKRSLRPSKNSRKSKKAKA